MFPIKDLRFRSNNNCQVSAKSSEFDFESCSAQINEKDLKNCKECNDLNLPITFP